MNTSQEIRFRFFNTRRNLPAKTRSKRKEANFLGAFTRTLITDIETPCAYGRYFSMPGCGVADFIICHIPTECLNNFNQNRISLTAIEVKISDWRKAIQQAYRYKYYADYSIVVIPHEKAARALESMRCFELLGIGLWTYNDSCGVIQKHYSPEERGYLNQIKRQQALSKIHSRITNLNFCKSHEYI
jgi:hypothetical protein